MAAYKKGIWKKFLLVLLIPAAAFSMMSGMAPLEPATPVAIDTTAEVAAVSAFAGLYDSLDLDSMELSREAYTFAIKGYENLLAQGTISKQDVLSIVDFSLPSSKKRLFIVNLHTGKLLFNTYVSHGRNSGMENATRFSNDLNSFQSSLGFYITGKTYKGEHGYSLRLEGLEKGINDNATNRGIVIHAATYVNEKMAQQRGYIGRSLGCPAIPVTLHKPIIQAIKEGSCLFLYGPDTSYTAKSVMMNGFKV